VKQLRWFTACIPLVTALAGPGCFWVTTKSEGEALRKDLTHVQGRLDAKEKTLDDQIAQLQKVLEDATKVLKRNSADIGADVDSLRNDVRTANGLVTTVNNSINELKQAFDTYRKGNDARMDAIEQRVVQIESGKATASSSPEELWKLGSSAFEAARYNDAIDIFKRLSQTYPTHERAAEAVYFRGQSYSNLKDWDHAIGVYQQLFDKYPASALADDGLYFAAVAAGQLKNCTEARTYLGLIKQKYPKSNVTKQADELDRTIKKDLKNKAKCTS
jgi:TolA-binding protein